MNAMFVGAVFTVVWLVIAVPALLLLLRAYGRTRMTAFVWLAVAIVGWPLVARVISMMLPVLVATVGVGMSQGLLGLPWLNVFVLVSLLESIVGGVLLILALVILDRQLAARTPNQAAAPPVPPATF